MIPEVSIIIPTCNRRHFLEQSLQSALSQNFESFEIVVVDNASTDSTKRFLGSIQEPKVRVFEQSRRVSMQENIWQALQHAYGEFSVVLCDDDLLNSEFLAHGIKALHAQVDPFFFTAAYNHIDSEGDPIRLRKSVPEGGVYRDPHMFASRNRAALSATLFPTKAVRDIGFVDNIFFDWAWWNSLCLSGLGVCVSSSPLASYRIHRLSMQVSDFEYAEATRDMCHFLANRYGSFKQLDLLLKTAETKRLYWGSRHDPSQLLPFVAYGCTHWSPQTLKLLLMRCLPLDTVNFLRHMLRPQTFIG